jgi:hypothetical protein
LSIEAALVVPYPLLLAYLFFISLDLSRMTPTDFGCCLTISSSETMTIRMIVRSNCPKNVSMILP